MKPINALIARGVLMLAVIFSTGCVSMENHRAKHPDPNDRLDQMLELYRQALAKGSECREVWRADHATIDCDRILREVERLYVEFPGNRRVLMSAASVNFAAGQFQKAQFLLDELLARSGSNPEAAILRSQIALREGNTTLAKNLVAREILIAPDRPDLREMLAAIHYFAEDYEDARRSLAMAGRLGAPGWRVTYHIGLLEEAAGDWDRACSRYAIVLEQRSDHRPSLTRLVGLSDHVSCRETLSDSDFSS